MVRVRASSVIGADGARSARLARQTIKGGGKTKCVFAYHEIIRSPSGGEGGFNAERCDVFYQGKLSPDFYAWIFPARGHGQHRRRQRPQGLFPPGRGEGAEGLDRAAGLRDRPHRGRADSR